MLCFRDDDIGFNPHKTDRFKEIHEIFNKYKVIHTIAVIAKDIDAPEFRPLVKYIKKQKNIDVQLHCWQHDRITPQEFAINLPKGIDKITKVFGKRPTVFYPPWNEVALWMIGCCKENNIIINASKISLSQYLRGARGKTINFHYWSDECTDLEEAIKKSL